MIAEVPGVRLISFTRSPESSWNPHGINVEESWGFHGIRIESVRNSHDNSSIPMESPWNPHGFLSAAIVRPHQPIQQTIIIHVAGYGWSSSGVRFDKYRGTAGVDLGTAGVGRGTANQGEVRLFSSLE